MIRFFRKIRQRLLTENPPTGQAGRYSKYLIYAIGEVALVMIGILLALQVNNWNNGYIERKEEKQLLTQLRTEYFLNLAQLDDKLLLRQNLITCGEKILDLVSLPKPKINPDSLNRLLSKTLIAPTFEASLGVTNEILYSGKLYLIENDELRNMISGWSGVIDEATEVDLMWKDQRDRFYIPFLIETFQIRNVYNELLNDFEILSVMTGDNSKTSESFGKSMKEINIQTFLIDSELEDYISHMLTLNYVAKAEMARFYNMTETMLELINEELDNK